MIDILNFTNKTFYYVTSQAFLLQIGLIFLFIISTYGISFLYKFLLSIFGDKLKNKDLIKSLVFIKKLFVPLTLFILFYFCQHTGLYQYFDYGVLQTVDNLLILWVLFALSSILITDKSILLWIKIIITLCVVANLFGYLNPLIIFLQKTSIGFGSTKTSLYLILKGILLFITIIWLTIHISKAIEKKISRLRKVSPSLKVLLKKAVSISLFLFAFLLGLDLLGIDLTGLTIFSGAIGVGVGFGLQKIVSNFISGIILLSDRSIKPGDVIGIGNTYGWVNSLGARYVSLITRDGMEHLIPNEQLITEKVENWSFSNEEVRIKIPFGISYDSDPELAKKIAIDIIKKFDRILSSPEPVCLMKNFGDNAIEFELRMWIDDPSNGISNIKSDILFELLKKFKLNNIQIPFPQRDIHIKNIPDQP